jgi:hypothetical protein
MKNNTALTSRRVAQTIVLTAALASSALDAAQAGSNRIGWLLADQPNSSVPYTPNPLYSYNSVGNTISVTPLSEGFYRAEFGNLHTAAARNMQVSAYGTNGYCTASGETTGPNNAEEFFVSCFNVTGALANSEFTLLYQGRGAPFGTADKGVAFVWADQPTASSYTPGPGFNYNSTNNLNTVVRTAVGSYSVTLTGLSKEGGDVQVTAVNAVQSTSNPARCKSDGWGTNGSANVAKVECFDSSGAPADEMFSLAFALNVPFGITTLPRSRGAYAWTNRPTVRHVYTPEKIWNYGGFGTGRMTSQKIATGDYMVSLPGDLSYGSSLVLVTGYDNGNASAYCNVVDWFPIEIKCYSQGGGPVDSEFNVAFQTQE